MNNLCINKSNNVYKINELAKMKLDNLASDGKYIYVLDKTKKGVLESSEVSTLEYRELIGSWCALTPDEKSFINLEISVFVNNKWSKYFTYGDWRLYGENLYYDQDDADVKMRVDEILPKEDYKGNAFKFRVTLTNNTKLFLVTISYEVEKYSNVFDKALLEKDAYKCYDVPKLNQNMVPVIGHEMCSATTTAMLLKYKGMDFTKFDSEFEHRYVAGLVADRGHNEPTFGNWVYNTAVLGGFGFNGYCYRVNNFEELKYLFDNVGPVGVSIRGETGVYHTGGHLMVAIGYKVKDGKAYVLCNDPNINARFGEGLFVYYEYPIDVFNNFFRGMCYVVE